MLFPIAPFQLVTVSPPVQLPKDVIDLLQQTKWGTWALGVFKKYSPALHWNPDPKAAPALYDATADVCRINPKLASPIIASYFTHEMYHVQQAKTGKSGDVTSKDRKKYVDTMVMEEIQGTLFGYLMFLELDQKGQIPTSCRRPLYYLDFKCTHPSAQAYKLRQDPTASPEDLHAFAVPYAKGRALQVDGDDRDAGRQRLGILHRLLRA